MTADPIPKQRMTVDEFLAWADGQPGRYELVDGEVFAMSPERMRHALVKLSTQSALGGAIARADLPCHVVPDGLAVRVDADTTFEPDALVYCGAPIDLEAVEVPEPILVVEVLSPRTKHVDTGAKLVGYFQIASLVHYLILDPVGRRVVHHRRSAGELIETRIVTRGALDLDPPGLSVPIAELFARV